MSNERPDETIRRLRAELEQAERERDEERRRFHQLFIEHSANHDRLAKAPALVEALKDAKSWIENYPLNAGPEFDEDWPALVRSIEAALAAWQAE